jgi:PTS system cellobiose-specific IIC component
MKKIEEVLKQILLPIASKLESNPQMAAIRRGMMTLIPVTLVGSIPILFWQLPGIPGMPQWFIDMCNGIAQVTNPIHFASFGFMGLYVAAFIGWYYAHERKVWDIGGTVTSIMAFTLVANLPTESGVGNDMSYFGGTGIFTAILVSLLAVEILYIFKYKLKFTIDLGPGVPTPVKRSFENLWPILFSVLSIAVLNYAIQEIAGYPVVKLVEVLFSPLTASVNTLPGILLILFVVQLLWWFGIHGYAVMAPIWIGVAFQNADANAQMLQAGAPLSDMYIFTPDFMWNLAGLTGSGLIGSIMILMLISKSKKFNAIGKLNLIPAFFGIGEPIVFGMPIVYNTVMLIPWILSAQVAAIIGWFSISSGFLRPFTMVSPYTPIPIGGVIATVDFKFIIVAALIILAGIVVYYPFFKIVEKQAIEAEHNEDKSEMSLDDIDF